MSKRIPLRSPLKRVENDVRRQLIEVSSLRACPFLSTPEYKLLEDLEMQFNFCLSLFGYELPKNKENKESKA